MTIKRFNPELLRILKNKKVRTQKEYDTFLSNADIGIPDDNDPVYFVIDLGLFSAHIINTDDDESFEIPVQIKYYNRYKEIIDDEVLQQYFDFFLGRMGLRELLQFANKEYGITYELKEDIEAASEEVERGGYCSLSEEEYKYELDCVMRDLFLDDPYITAKHAKLFAKETLEISGVYCRNEMGLITVLKVEIDDVNYTFVKFERDRDMIISELAEALVEAFGVETES